MDQVYEIEFDIAEDSSEDIEFEAEMDDGVSAYVAEGWAVGQHGGVDVSEDDPTYHNNAKYYAGVAQQQTVDAAQVAADRAAAEAAKAAAEAAQGAAESAQAGAVAAQGAAETAQTGAQSAQAAAETAQGAAEAAKVAAETAQGAAEGARTAAETARTGAEAAKVAAETAQTGAQSAKVAAEAAQGAAETAQTGAQSAKAAAEAAQTAAETARTGAETAQAAAEAAAINPPYIHATNKTWMVWDKDTSEYVDTGYAAQGPQGIQGETGATPDIQIGTVTTLAEGSQATAAMRGTPENPVLDLGIPKGDTGAVENVYGSNLPMASDDPTTVAAAIAAEQQARVAADTSLSDQIETLKHEVGPYMFSMERDPEDDEMTLYLYYPDGGDVPPITLEGDTIYWNY